MAREWVKCCSAPRISQMPLSCRSQLSSTKPMSARCSGQENSVSPTPASRAAWSASITSPITSAWYCSNAPLPTRTGPEPW